MRNFFDTSNYVGTWEMTMHASIDADEAKDDGTLGSARPVKSERVPLYTEPL
jgi:hypothetical protein